MTSVTVDSFRWTDISAAVDIETQSFDRNGWRTGTFWRQLAAAADGAALAARDPNGVLVGYAFVLVDPDDAHLHTIVVEQAARRMGVASALLGRLQKIATQLDKRRILLEVSEHNAAALQLYQRHGYTQLSHRAGYYGAGDAAIIMQLILPRPVTARYSEEAATNV